MYPSFLIDLANIFRDPWRYAKCSSRVADFMSLQKKVLLLGHFWGYPPVSSQKWPAGAWTIEKWMIFPAINLHS